MQKHGCERVCAAAQKLIFILNIKKSGKSEIIWNALKDVLFNAFIFKLH